jgi:3-hydroxyacyl-[acyl-carrier-protein] dehydratase
MQKNDLYKIILSQHKDCIINTTLELDKNSEIFTGHFPGQPVLPGACILQMVKEILERTLKIPLRLKKADQMKFLVLIDPRVHHTLQLMITYQSTNDNNLNIIASLTADKSICYKFKGSFIAK